MAVVQPTAKQLDDGHGDSERSYGSRQASGGDADNTMLVAHCPTRPDIKPASVRIVVQ